MRRLMKAFGAAHNAIFVAPTLYAHDFYADESISLKLAAWKT